MKYSEKLSSLLSPFWYVFILEVLVVALSANTIFAFVGALAMVIILDLIIIAVLFLLPVFPIDKMVSSNLYFKSVIVLFGLFSLFVLHHTNRLYGQKHQTFKDVTNLNPWEYSIDKFESIDFLHSESSFEVVVDCEAFSSIILNGGFDDRFSEKGCKELNNPPTDSITLVNYNGLASVFNSQKMWCWDKYDDIRLVKVCLTSDKKKALVYHFRD